MSSHKHMKVRSNRVGGGNWKLVACDLDRAYSRLTPLTVDDEIAPTAALGVIADSSITFCSSWQYFHAQPAAHRQAILDGGDEDILRSFVTQVHTEWSGKVWPEGEAPPLVTTANR